MVAAEAAEGSRLQREPDGAHAFTSSSLRSGSTAAATASESRGIERAEALGEPRRSPLADRAEDALALRRQLQPDPPSIVGRPDPHEKPRALEPVDVARKRRRRDPLHLGERTQRQSGASLDEPEQGRLPPRDPELLGLPAQLPCQAEENRAKLVGESEGIFSSVTNH